MPDSELVDLSRRYESVPLDQEDLETISARSVFAQFSDHEPGKSIEDLILKPLTIVLGEARSGKTTEFYLAAKRLQRDGRAAFFVRLEDLAHGGGTSLDAIRTSLSVDSVAYFESWVASTEKAVFFLDSVDESKLQGVGDYRRAVRTFQAALKQHLYRVKLVLSCRVTEWRPKDDVGPLAALKPHLAQSSDEGHAADNNDPIQLVQIVPLDQRRIEQLADHLGIEDKKQFIDAIKSADALEYVGRPGDAIENIQLWKQHGRLGTLTELIEQNIQRKLREEAEAYQGVLSSQKARYGAEILAAASVFCREASFRFLPAEQDPANALPAIDPTVILPEWKPEEIKAILRRPIFDEATYGRVRFHTRTVREYLAASWLRNRFKEGCPSSEIIGIFFSTKYGKSVAIPSRTSVAAWLAPHVPELVEHILKYNPEILPDEGDPQALAVAIRSKALTQLVQRYSDRSRTGYHFDRHGLRRFAHDDLATEIKHLLTKVAVADDTKSLLLDLVEVGKISACVETAKRIALDAKESSELRVDAVLALKGCEAKDQLRQVFEALKAAPAVSDRLYGWTIYAVYPQVVSPNELLELLPKISSQVVTVTQHIDDFVQRTTDEEKEPARLAILAPALLKLVGTSRSVGNEEVRPYRWLIRSLYNVTVNWLETTTTDPDWLYDSIDFIKAQKDSDYYTSKARKRVGELLAKAPPKLREKILWRRHAAYAARRNSANIWYAQFLNYYEVWKLVPSDVDWLLQRVRSESDPKRRFTAFDAALELIFHDPNQSNRNTDLREAATQFPDLMKHLKSRMTPRQPPLLEIKVSVSRWAKKLRNEWETLKNKETIIRDFPDIAAGKRTDHLCIMFENIRRPSGAYSEQDVWSLVPAYGKSGADAFRAGVKKFWPIWKSENSHRLGDDLALLGIVCAVADGLELASLEKPMVEQLTKLAFKDIDLPDWFSALVEHHEETVLGIVTVWLNAELRRNYENGAIPPILMEISHAHPKVRNAVAPQIFEIANANIPVGVAARQYVVRILGDGPYRHLLAKLSEGHLTDGISCTLDNIYWLAVWLQVAADDALDWLESRMQKLDQNEADREFLSLASHLDRSHNGGAIINGDPDYASVSSLRRVIPLAYRYVRPEDDPVHYGHWRPDARDSAQSFRGSLIGILAAIPGEQAYRTLLEVGKEIPYQLTRDWILKKSEERIGLDGDIPWEPSDVLEFERHHERDAHSADDLFEIGIKRLTEIRGQLEKGDYSLRDLFTPETHENYLQKYIAQRLRDLSRGRYSEVREPEVDNKKEPDIRLLQTSLSPISIEVKLAHKSRLAQLEDDLTNQLVGLYLRSEDSSHGIFVVVNALHNHTWSKQGKKKKFNFDELVAYLGEQAKNIEDSTPGVSQLKIIGIDLTK